MILLLLNQNYLKLGGFIEETGWINNETVS